MKYAHVYVLYLMFIFSLENRIAEGRYKNVSEVLRAGLRLLEEEENKIANFSEHRLLLGNVRVKVFFPLHIRV